MASTDLYPLVDRIVPGGLGPFLSAARAAGDSFETIARRLATDHEVSVSGDTVRRWSARAPEKSKVWARTGVAPDDQIRDYVRYVRRVAGRPL